MGKIFNTILAIGFAALLERGVKGFLDKRQEKRAVAKASRTGLGATVPATSKQG